MTDHHTHNRIRVLFINLYTQMGGGEVAILHLLKELDRTKFEPIMLFNGRGRFVEAVEALGVKTVIVPFQTMMLHELINPVKCWRTILASRTLGAFLRNNPMDIIHCSDVLSVLLVGIPATRMRIPILYSVIFMYEWTRLLLFNLLALLCVRLIVTNSDLVKNDLIRQTIALERKVRTVHPAVDTTLFRPPFPGETNLLRHELGIPDDVKLVGMVGRFDPAKGHDLFLSAAVEILRHRTDVAFVIAGGLVNADAFPSLGRFQNTIRDIASQKGLAERIVFLDHRDDMPEVIRSFDVLVCSSSSEGFGLAVVEAAASGVPVVARRNVGALEVLENWGGVFVPEVGNVLSFASTILQALEYQGTKSYHENRTDKMMPIPTWKQYSEAFAQLYFETSGLKDNSASASPMPMS